MHNYTYLLVPCFTLDNEKKIVSTQTNALGDGDYESLLKNHKALTGTLRHSVEQMHAGIKQWTMISTAVQVVFNGAELIEMPKS